MKYLLDTCFISELIKSKPNVGVLNWLEDKEESTLYLSALTLGEIKKGISKLPDSKKKKDLTKWLTELEKRFEDRIISIDPDISLKWGLVQGELEQNGKSMPTIDALIACSALVHNLTVITHNAKDIKRSKVEVFDPWE
ncbi:MAG: type II toxin-antitoxin system VapC family toxin [Leptospiraceae bacterium]|nr:type II toxin-antitoxin system VapC family toxin [Leptospiraceae bacterium]